MAACQTLSADTNRLVRGTIASLLGDIRDSRSIYILIEMVDDHEVMFLDYTGNVQVGDNAEWALATLTGETFGRDRSRWTNWWGLQNGRLPEISGENKALQRLKEANKTKGKERQKQLEKQ